MCQGTVAVALWVLAAELALLFAFVFVDGTRHFGSLLTPPQSGPIVTDPREGMQPMTLVLAVGAPALAVVGVGVFVGRPRWLQGLFLVPILLPPLVLGLFVAAGGRPVGWAIAGAAGFALATRLWCLGRR